MLVATNFFVEISVRQNLDKRGLLGLLLRLNTSLVGNEALQRLKVTAAAVVHRVLALAIEKLECREALYAKLATEVLLSVGVDLGDLDLALGVLEARRQLYVDGSQVLAVAAPWCEDWNILD